MNIFCQGCNEVFDSEREHMNHSCEIEPSEIELLRTRLASAEEVATYYADTKNWSETGYEDSRSRTEGDGGKRAREHFAKFKESEKCTK